MTIGTFLAIATLIGYPAYPKAEGLEDLKPIPDGVFLDLEGSKRALSEFRGKVVLINFWGTWCVPCLREIPELVVLSHQLKRRGLEVIGIAVDSGRPEDIRAFMTQHGMDYHIRLGELGLVKRVFRIVGFPTSLLIDRHGMVRKRYVGPQTLEVFRKDVEALL